MKNKILVIGIMLLVLAVATSEVVYAESPHGQPLSPPAPPGASSGGGGGSYTPPTFTKTTESLKSSDGTIIGRLDGENFNSYMFWAEKNGTIGNVTYVLTVEGELSSKPDDCWLDIAFLEPNSSGLPPGMANCREFAMVNVTKKPDGWGWKPDNPIYTLKISGVTLNPGDSFYIVRSSGPDYQLQKVTVDVSGDQATIKFSPAGDAGLFTLMVPVLPTPTPTSTPVPTPTVTPLPPDNGTSTYAIYAVFFMVGAIAGMALLFLLMRKR